MNINRWIEAQDRKIGLLIMMQAVFPEKRGAWKISELHARMERSAMLARHDPVRFAAEWLRDTGFSEESFAVRGVELKVNDVHGHNPKRCYFAIAASPEEWKRYQ